MITCDWEPFLTMDGPLKMKQVIYIDHVYQRTKCTLFLIVGPDFITDLHFLIKEYVPLIWFFFRLIVRQSRCDPYRLVVNNFCLFYALSSLLLKLENKNVPGLCISITKIIAKTWNFTFFFRDNTIFELSFLLSKNELVLPHVKDGRRKRPLTGFFYGIWWNIYLFRAYNVTWFVLIILFSKNMQQFKCQSYWISVLDNSKSRRKMFSWNIWWC